MKWAGVIVISVAVIAFVAAVVVFTRPAGSERGLAEEDLAWVKRYEPWRSSTQTRLRAAYDDAAFVATSEELDALIRPIRGCARSYAALGPVPAALADVDEQNARACAIAGSIVARFERSSAVADASRKTRLKLAATALANARTRLFSHLRLAGRLPSSDDGSKSRVEPRLTALATELVSANVEVRCWSDGDWREVRRELAALVTEDAAPEPGSAGVWSGAVQLAPLLCNRLLAVDAATRPRNPDALVGALDTLGHAVSHATGTVDEASASCDGLQAVRALAEDLGVGAQDVSGLAARAWTLYRARELGAWSAGCRDSGPLDRDLSTAWP